MRFNAMLGMLLRASVAAAGVGAALPVHQQKQLDNMIARLPGSDGKTRRSKVKPDRRAKRGNMNHVSRRTKRKHRRAA